MFFLGCFLCFTVWVLFIIILLRCCFCFIVVSLLFFLSDGLISCKALSDFVLWKVLYKINFTYLLDLLDTTKEKLNPGSNDRWHPTLTGQTVTTFAPHFFNFTSMTDCIFSVQFRKWAINAYYQVILSYNIQNMLVKCHIQHCTGTHCTVVCWQKNV